MATQWVAADLLSDQLGFDPVDTGGLAESWRLEPGQAAFVTRQDVAHVTADVANATRHA